MKKGRVYGYARVSSVGQSLEVQQQKLLEAGCTKIFEEKVSGGSLSGREELERLLHFMDEGDVLVVTKLDRIARSMADFWKIVDRIENDIHGGIRILNIGDGEVIDTTTGTGRLILGVLSSVAEWERTMIKERQREGVANAMAKGVKFGRPTTNDDKLNHAIELLAEGKTKKEVSNIVGIGQSTLYRLLAQKKTGETA